MYEYSGNVHIHSDYSDGSGSVDDIASYAREAGLDFIVLNDHFSLYQNDEGYINGVLVLQGMEVNDTANHYLAMDIEKTIDKNVEYPQRVIDDVNAQNGIGIIAHPFEKGSPLFHNRRTYPWKDWSVQGFQGIEIWNFLSQWRDGVSGIIKGIYLMINPHSAFIQGPYREALKVLDRYQQEGCRIILAGGSDAHNALLRIGPLKFRISPYDLCFKCINMHILTEERFSGIYLEDREKFYNAMRKGKCWVAYDFFKNSRGFSFVIRSRTEEWGMGESIPLQNSLQAEVRTPYKARVVLMKNGRCWEKSQGQKHVFERIREGVYRVEVFHAQGLRYRPWIFSNSIWVTKN
jgi:hypothetical protein